MHKWRGLLLFRQLEKARKTVRIWKGKDLTLAKEFRQLTIHVKAFLHSIISHHCSYFREIIFKTNSCSLEKEGSCEDICPPFSSSVVLAYPPRFSVLVVSSFFSGSEG